MDNKTPIQTALEKISSLRVDSSISGYEVINEALDHVIIELSRLLPAEKKLLEDTWKAGESYGYNKGTIYDESSVINPYMTLNQYMNKFNYQL